jgi:hypothetical protein
MLLLFAVALLFTRPMWIWPTCAGGVAPSASW